MPDKEKNQCRFIKDPFDDCYVLEMSSQSVEKVMYYCGENYQKCHIYKRALKANSTVKHPDGDRTSSTRGE